jgi:hypothetical protein
MEIYERNTMDPDDVMLWGFSEETAPLTVHGSMAQAENNKDGALVDTKGAFVLFQSNVEIFRVSRTMRKVLWWQRMMTMANDA